MRLVDICEISVGASILGVYEFSCFQHVLCVSWYELATFAFGRPISLESGRYIINKLEHTFFPVLKLRMRDNVSYM